MNGRIKVLYLNYSYDIGGIETWIRDMCAALPRERFEISVCSLSDRNALAGEFRAMDVPLHVIPKKEGVDYSLIFKLKELCGRMGIAVLHTHNAAQWFYGALAGIGMRGLSLVHTQHSVPDSRGASLPLALRHLASRTNAVVSVAGHVSRYLSKVVGVDEADIRLIHNGVEAERFAQASHREAARQALGIPRDRLTIGTAGRLVPVKDHRSLLIAFRLVADAVSGIQLVVAGDGPLRGELERCARELGIADKVYFLGSRRDVPEVLAALDAFVLPSLSEGLPITLLEAMAAGLPAVATDVGGTTEVLVHGETGYLVPPARPRELAAALSGLLRNPEKAGRFGRNARERVRAQFDLAKMTKEYAGIYEAITERR